jgi:hypothetical protein
MPVSKNRKNHKAKVAKRRQEHELKRHRTAQFGAKINDLLRHEADEKQRQESNEMLMQTWNHLERQNGSLPSFEILPTQNSII